MLIIGFCHAAHLQLWLLAGAVLKKENELVKWTLYM